MEPDVQKLAALHLAVANESGLQPPFAPCATAKKSQGTPLWIIRDASCTSLEGFWSGSFALAMATEMNRLSLFES